jgi:anaerobic magnesium-protoporphyrin IX monomethyl ester cyclase
MGERKKIILYNPKSEYFTLPLALLAIGSVLDPRKYDPIILDGRLEANIEELLAKYVNSSICFATTVITGSPVKDALKISRKVKSLNSKIPVIWGGWHPSLFPEQILKDSSFVDITVQGQGEETFKILVDYIDHALPLNEIKGICYRQNGLIIKNLPRPLIPMENFAKVNYDLVDIERYFRKKNYRQFDYISSVGCRFRCAFCADPFVFGRLYMSKSDEKMAEEIEYYYKKYQFSDLNFQDETYFTLVQRVENFAREIIKRNIKFTWAATMRADQGTRISNESWLLLKKSGLRKLLIGVESGSQEMMDNLKKDIKLSQVFECANTCKELGIAVDFPFIVGFPEESDQNVKESISIIKKLRMLSPFFKTPVFFFQPYPGSTIIGEAEKNGFKLPVSTQDWGNFDFENSSIWVSEKKKKFFTAFMFYLNLAFGEKRFGFFWLTMLAKWRCKHDQYKFPFEIYIYKIARKIFT